MEYASNAFQTLKDAGIRVELDDSSETLGKKIRAAAVQKIPYTLVIGDKEIESNTVTVESRDHGKLGAVSIEDAVVRFKAEIADKK
jgi:threonyl-tRNA synthetase